MSHLVYSALLVITLAYPLLRSFEYRLRMYRKWKYMMPAMGITAFLFIVWDYWFVREEVWSFNDHFILGVRWMHLPLEELLFFIVIPYACFFIYEVGKYFIRQPIPGRIVLIVHVCVAVLLLLLGIAHIEQLYTLFVAVSTGGMLLILVFLPPFRKNVFYFYCAFLLSLIPFLLINGVLTALPVVMYNSGEILGLRIFTIPFEDVIYLLLLLFINFALYEILNVYDAKQIKFNS